MDHLLNFLGTSTHFGDSSLSGGQNPREWAGSWCPEGQGDPLREDLRYVGGSQLVHTEQDKGILRRGARGRVRRQGGPGKESGVFQNLHAH